MKINLGLIAVVLTAVFATLKLTGNIDWSWWIVFLPLLLFVGLLIVIFLFIGLIAALALKYGD